MKHKREGASSAIRLGRDRMPALTFVTSVSAQVHQLFAEAGEGLELNIYKKGKRFLEYCVFADLAQGHEDSEALRLRLKSDHINFFWLHMRNLVVFSPDG